LNCDSAAYRLLVDQNPISAGGRILDVFVEIWAITVIPPLAGAIGSFLQKRGQEVRTQALTNQRLGRAVNAVPVSGPASCLLSAGGDGGAGSLRG